MAKKRLYLVAREYNITSDAIVKMCRDLGYPVKNHMSTADDEMLAAIDMRFKKERETIKREIETKKAKAISRAKEKKKELEREAEPEPEPGDRDEKLQQYDEEAPKVGIEKIKAKDTKTGEAGRLSIAENGARRTRGGGNSGGKPSIRRKSPAVSRRRLPGWTVSASRNTNVAPRVPEESARKSPMFCR